jgi:hypothetical protein
LKEVPLSDLVTTKTAIRDATAIRAACQWLGLAQPVQGTTRLFSGEVTGFQDVREYA